MHDEELFHKLLILRTPGIGPVKYAELTRKFGTAAAAADSLNAAQEHADSVKREMDRAAQLGIIYVSDDSDDYPANLKQVKNHPPVISARGNIAALRRPAVGMVGTRHATAAGMRFVSDLAAAFAGHGFAVVSGMAMGTDTAAHNGALSVAGDENTIAVLAGGADYIWPLENEKLYHYILERGAAISEMPVAATPIANNFIQRNRWIAGISEKLILGEADEDSGSMSTAAFALDLNRPVFAIPGHPSDARSAGPNRLIKSGLATLCIGRQDFFEFKDDKGQSPKKAKPHAENTLMDLIGTESVSESVLAKLAEKNVNEVKSQLVVLELNGLVKKVNGGYVKA
ncbi:MAG: DNA-processing protein DprA [Proteobacteria bacterium]|nr:DNA-processing protein DprA [Pseudomonadota bacterium]